MGLLSQINQYCHECARKGQTSTGTIILERGETALLSRSWLAQNASTSIDVQYFIWSNDNIGILAAEALLSAARRGVKVRVIVDDFLVDADSTSLLSLAAHPNVDIQIYNPLHRVGVSKPEKLFHLVFNFRGSNQRMHDKVVIFDQAIAITGGRNMADEYFDFNQQYAFRDRDVLVYGKAIDDIQKNFDAFWHSPLTKNVNELLKEKTDALSSPQIATWQDALTDYAKNPKNFAPEVKSSIQQLKQKFPELVEEIQWSKARFIHDAPGKNDGQSGLEGGGQSTQALIQLLKQAKQEVLIQSPYLVIPDEGIYFLQQLVDKGVRIKISTNSMASTDNLYAFSGYYKQRQRLLEAGIQIFEFKPHPQNQAELYQRFQHLEKAPPIFAIHAKSMVIDGQIAFIGTFNLDPRSMHLNTEVGLIIPNPATAQELKASILDDMDPGNSWEISDGYHPDAHASFWKKTKVFLFSLLPLQAVL